MARTNLIYAKLDADGKLVKLGPVVSINGDTHYSDEDDSIVESWREERGFKPLIVQEECEKPGQVCFKSHSYEEQASAIIDHVSYTLDAAPENNHLSDLDGVDAHELTQSEKSSLLNSLLNYIRGRK